MQKLKNLLTLFLTMLKIGIFTFGGGYAMISLLENEFVTKKQWLSHDEFIDLLAISESTPGPIAINNSTFIGYKIEKFWGSLVATLGMVLPSFVIIYVISLFFNQFLAINWVASAFKGIQVCVVFLILSAGMRMIKHLQKNAFSIIVFTLTLVCMTAFSLFAVNFSAVLYILISATVGTIIYSANFVKAKKRGNCADNGNSEVQK